MQVEQQQHLQQSSSLFIISDYLIKYIDENFLLDIKFGEIEANTTTDDGHVGIQVNRCELWGISSHFAFIATGIGFLHVAKAQHKLARAVHLWNTHKDNVARKI